MHMFKTADMRFLYKDHVKTIMDKCRNVPPAEHLANKNKFNSWPHVMGGDSNNSTLQSNCDTSRWKLAEKNARKSLENDIPKRYNSYEQDCSTNVMYARILLMMKTP